MPPPLQQFEQYALLGEIASGGMGVVHQAVHRRLNRSCALKLIRAGLLASPDERRRFLTEAEAASTLDHPGIVRVRRAGEFEGQWFLEMDLVEGGTLADRLREGPLLPEHAARLVASLARAVQHAHGHGVLHRDLKPANVLLDWANEPKLTDFGLARFLGRDSELTRTLAVLGTPAYMAPELASGRAREATTAADTYSLGVILFECLTGERPFQGLTPLEILRAVREAPTPRPSTLRPSLPRDLEVIVMRCLAREPERRFPSAGELADDLERFSRGEPIHSRRVPPLERLWLWGRRHPRLAAMAATILVGTVVGTAVIGWQWQRAEFANHRLETRLAADAIKDAAHLCAQGDQPNGLLRALGAMQDAPHQAALKTWLHARLANDAFLVPERQFRHPGEVGTATFDRTRGRVATAGQGGVRVFDRGSGALMAHVETQHQVSSSWLGARGDGLLTFRDGEFVRLWDLRMPAQPNVLWGATGIVAVALSQDQARFLAATGAGSAWLGSLDQPQPAQPAPDLPAAPLALAANTNGSVFAAALADGRLLVLRPPAKGWLTLATQQTNVLQLSLTPDGQSLVAVSTERVGAWRLGDSQCTFSHRFATPPRAFAVSPDGSQAVSSEQDGRLRLTDLASSRVLDELPSLVTPAFLEFSRAGRHLLLTGDEGTVCLLSVSPLRVIATAKQPQTAWNVDFDEPAGLLVASGSDDVARLFRLVPAITNATARVPDGIVAGVPLAKAQSLLLLSSGGSVLWGEVDSAGIHLRPLASWPAATALAAADVANPAAFLGDSHGQVLQLDCTSQDQPRPLFRLPEPIRHLAVSADAHWLAVAETNRLHLARLDPSGATLLTNWAVPDVRCLSFSPAGNRLAVGAWSGLVVVFDTDSCRLRWADTNHFGLVASLAFSADGRRLASASLDRFAHVWDAATGAEVLPPLEHPMEASSAAFDLAGNTLAIGCDRQVSLWNARSGRLLARLQLPGKTDVPRRFTHSVAFAPSGNLLAAADGIGCVSVWETSLPSLTREWGMLTAEARGASRTRCAWLGERRLIAWSQTCGVQSIDFPPPPSDCLLLDLAEWVIGQAVNDDGAVIRLDEPARGVRLARLQAAAATGELTPALARLLPARR